MLNRMRTHDRELFEQLALITDSLLTSARLLHQLLSGGAADAGETAAAARRLEGAQVNGRKVNVRDLTAFAMRLDRMEYRSLALALDAAFEATQEATAHAHALHATEAPGALRELAALLADAAAALAALVPEAGRPVKGSQDVEELRARGDALYYAGVGALLQGVPDPAQVLRWTDVYDAVRLALGRCADAAELLVQLGQ